MQIAKHAISLLTLAALATLTLCDQAHAERIDESMIAETVEEEPILVEETQLSSEACRLAVETFPINPSACSNELSETNSSVLQGELLSYLAIGYARTNQPTDARAAIEQALSSEPEYWLVHANHGVMLLYLSDFRSAFEATNRALGLTQQPIPDLYLNLALAARGSGEFGTAENAYNTYLDLMGFAPTPTTPNLLDAYGPPQSGMERGMERGTKRELEGDSSQQRFSGDPFKATSRVQPR